MKGMTFIDSRIKDFVLFILYIKTLPVSNVLPANWRKNPPSFQPGNHPATENHSLLHCHWSQTDRWTCLRSQKQSVTKRKHADIEEYEVNIRDGFMSLDSHNLQRMLGFPTVQPSVQSQAAHLECQVT